MEGRLYTLTTSPAQPPASGQKSRVGSGVHARGPWFHPGLSVRGGGIEGERKCKREKGVQRDVGIARQSRGMAPCSWADEVALHGHEDK